MGLPLYFTSMWIVKYPFLFSLPPLQVLIHPHTGCGSGSGGHSYIFFTTESYSDSDLKITVPISYIILFSCKAILVLPAKYKISSKS